MLGTGCGVGECGGVRGGGLGGGELAAGGCAGGLARWGQVQSTSSSTRTLGDGTFLFFSLFPLCGVSECGGVQGRTGPYMCVRIPPASGRPSTRSSVFIPNQGRGHLVADSNGRAVVRRLRGTPGHRRSRRTARTEVCGHQVIGAQTPGRGMLAEPCGM
jgi:hypothetical protein